MKYAPKQFVTVDILLFREKENKLEVLFIQRLKEPYKDAWAIPGGFLDEGEDLMTAALRELKEETNVTLQELKQLKAYGHPDRDPRHHTISVAFWTLLQTDVHVKAMDDAKDFQWFPINELPVLAFDHDQIVKDGTEALLKQIKERK